MLVGTKAIATLSTGYLNALDVRQGTGAGPGSDSGRRQDRAAGDHHPPPGHPPLADEPEVLRRRAAGAGAVHREHPGPGRDRPARGHHRRGRRAAERPAVARSSRATARSAPGCCSAPSRCRPSVVRVPGRLPDRAVRPRCQDRHALRGHHGHPGPGPVLPQDRPGPGRGADRPDRADRGLAPRPRAARGQRTTEGGTRAAGDALDDAGRIVAIMVGDLEPRLGDRAGTRGRSTRSA